MSRSPLSGRKRDIDEKDDDSTSVDCALPVTQAVPYPASGLGPRVETMTRSCSLFKISERPAVMALLVRQVGAASRFEVTAETMRSFSERSSAGTVKVYQISTSPRPCQPIVTVPSTSVTKSP